MVVVLPDPRLARSMRGLSCTTTRRGGGRSADCRARLASHRATLRIRSSPMIMSPSSMRWGSNYANASYAGRPAVRRDVRPQPPRAARGYDHRVKQLIPDVEALDAHRSATSAANAIGNLRYSPFLPGTRAALGALGLQSSPRPVRSDGYVDFRITGRDIRLRIDVATPIIQPFTLGQHLIDAVTRGDR